jgi:hypothetical protein
MDAFVANGRAILSSGPVTITAPNNTNITFNSTIDGAPAITIDAGSGTVILGGAIGGTTPPASLTVTGPARLYGNITVNGNVTFNNAVVIYANIAIDTDGTGGGIWFKSTLDSNSSTTPRDLLLSAGSGAITFDAAVGGSTVVFSLYAGGYTGSTGLVSVYSGSAWTAMNPPGFGNVLSLAMAPDGTLYACGTGGGLGRVSRYLSSTWTAMDPAGFTAVYALEIAADGTLYAAGTSGGTSGRVSKYSSSIWTAMNPSGFRYVNLLAMATDGTLYAAGWSGSAGAVNKYSGSSWTTLNLSGFVNVLSLAVATDGTLYAGGYTGITGLVSSYSSSTWTAMNPPGFANVSSLAVATDGTLYAGGYSAASSGLVSKYSSSAWTAMDPAGFANVRSLTIASTDGTLYAAGYSGTTGLTSRYSSSTWTAMNPGGFTSAGSIVVYEPYLALGSITINSASNATFNSTVNAASLTQTAGTGATAFNGNVTLSGVLDITNNAVNIVKTMNITGASDINGALNMNSGSSWTLANTLDVTGDITLTGGTLSAGAHSITVTGNWINRGTFTCGSSTVTLNGSGHQDVLTGGSGSAFNILTITNTAANSVAFTDALYAATLNAGAGVQKILFAANTTHTISGSLNINGSNSLITLASLRPGSQWNIAIPGARSISFVSVQDSNNTGSGPVFTILSHTPSACIWTGNSVNNGNNTNWFAPHPPDPPNPPDIPVNPPEIEIPEVNPEVSIGDDLWSVVNIDYEAARLKRKYIKGRYITAVIVYEGRVVIWPYDEKGVREEGAEVLNAGQSTTQKGEIK